jgi:creatinine amidohydrolase
MPATMTAVVVEVGRWVHASGFRKLVLVNGHATNGPPCQSALMQLRHELPDLRPRFVSLFDLSPTIAARYTEDAPDFHANEAETSMLLHLAPATVEFDAAVDEPVGTPTQASADRGRELFEQLVSELIHLLTAAREEHDPQL